VAKIESIYLLIVKMPGFAPLRAVA